MPLPGDANMQALLLSVDRASTIIGKVFAWCIVLLTLQVTYEVTVRYAFASPTAWGYDVSYMLYGALFMMAGAYTLARNGHVRGDFLYRQWPVRRQAAFDLVLYFVFFLPGMIALIVAGWSFFIQSFAQNERSAFTPNGPIIWPFKFLIPLVGVLLLLQGAVEVARCGGAPHRRMARPPFRRGGDGGRHPGKSRRRARRAAAQHLPAQRLTTAGRRRRPC